MQKYAVNDHCLDPETGVLKNKLGVQAPAILEQREFINHLAYKNGFSIAWDNIAQEDMIQASIESFHEGDTTRFAGFIRDNLHIRIKVRD
jgi:fido (protein-threonine AMPylation protein)